MPLPSILLVEDDPRQLELLSLVLRHLPNPIYKAHGGAEALAMLEDETPAVIILDVAMPGISGLDVLHAVRTNPRLSETKVLIVTAVPARVTIPDIAQAERLLTK